MKPQRHIQRFDLREPLDLSELNRKPQPNVFKRDDAKSESLFALFVVIFLGLCALIGMTWPIVEELVRTGRL